MHQLKVNSFARVDLTPEEERQAYSFTQLQLAGIQNLISEAAEDLLRQPLDEDDITIPSIKRRAFLRGQIAVLRHLQALHDNLNSEEGTE